ncbi:MAG: nucleotide pyrophosphohydrolase [Clostridiales bacterium]|jgi:NTP pyrophosphatase (non-canonical NTP hydrolase)|nr:nucleotide pyrophosphohydrolase [Eubacteriales bacterium]MDH7567726.1 nucleotide pyrophosphohydrolase [Clostridiales bacterium]
MKYTEGLDLSEAVKALLKFREERDWEQFHTPKNLSMSVAIEAAELMEHFQWKNDDEIGTYLKTEAVEKVKEEIADISAYLLMLSHDLGINLNQAILEKIKKNERKYPLEKSRGRHNKYDDL